MAPALTTTLYAPNHQPISNPERGFVHQEGNCKFSENDYERYRTEAIPPALVPEPVTLVRCIFYLDEAPDKTVPDIEDSVARFVEQAERARVEGVKLIVRFAYRAEQEGEGQPPNNVSWDLVEGHLNALEPKLRKFRDVVMTVESGIVGAFGEGAYSHFFGDLTKTAEPPT